MIKITPHFTSKPKMATDVTMEKSGEQKPKKKKYNDPLNQWPTRGLAFTNDVGAAIMDVAPTLGKLFWVPALMYFGADIYDKYKNDKTSYDPSKNRALKQATFQALASVIFPIAIVHAGQKIMSASAKHAQAGLTLQSMEDISEYSLDFMEKLHLKDYQTNQSEYKQKYLDSLKIQLEGKARDNKLKNPLTGVFKLLFGSKHPEDVTKPEIMSKIEAFANSKIDRMFEMRETLLKGEKPEQMSKKLFKAFNDAKDAFSKDITSSDSVSDAAKHVLKEFEKSRIFKTKLIKSIGGFVALGLLIKPMDSFVEHVIMHKYVGPGFDKFAHSDVDKFKENNIAFKGEAVSS